MNNNSNHIQAWDNCLQIIKQIVEPRQYSTWFEPIRAISLIDSKLTGGKVVDENCNEITTGKWIFPDIESQKSSEIVFDKEVHIQNLENEIISCNYRIQNYENQLSIITYSLS